MNSHEIECADLRVGHEIATKFRKIKDDEGNVIGREPIKFAKVAEVSDCAGRWRTHVHVKVEGTSIPWCYDGRDTVTVKGRAPLPDATRDGLLALAGAR